MKFAIVIFCLGLFSIHCANAQTKPKFPSYVKICKRNSEAMKCIIDNINRCKPYLPKGIPRLAIPPMGPFIIPALDVINNNLAINLKDVHVHNLNAMEVLGGSVDFEDFTLNIDLRIPYIYNEFAYEANGRILVLTFNGKGTGNVNSSDINIHINAKAHEVMKEGRTKLEVDDVNVSYKSGNGHFHLDNLFQNRADLNEQTNRLINDNFREFENEISPDIAKSIAELIKSIARNLFDKFAYDELFPLE